MSALPKEVVQKIVKENSFQTPQEIMAFMKESFRDLIQKMLEAELEVELGYAKGENSPAGTKILEMDILKKLSALNYQRREHDYPFREGYQIRVCCSNFTYHIDPFIYVALYITY